MIKDNPFWNFSVKIYQHPIIEKLCIQAQDDFGLNINLVLFYCWLGRKALTVNSEQMLLIDSDIANISQLTRQLRNFRRSLTFKTEKTNHIYQRVKTLELKTEHIQQNYLYRWFLVNYKHCHHQSNWVKTLEQYINTSDRLHQTTHNHWINDWIQALLFIKNMQ